jgi:hypothetical protein
MLAKKQNAAKIATGTKTESTVIVGGRNFENDMAPSGVLGMLARLR